MFNLRENYQEDGYAKIDEHPEKESRGLLRYGQFRRFEFVLLLWCRVGWGFLLHLGSGNNTDFSRNEKLALITSKSLWGGVIQSLCSPMQLETPNL